MKQPGVIVTLLVFIAAVSFVLAAQQKQGARPLSATLTGLTGDADGSGTAKFLLNPGQAELCYEISVANIAPPSNITILSGSTSKLLSFAPNSATNSTGMLNQCVAVERDKLMDIARNPTYYSVNVQNSEYPNGALRGQLSR
jgi:hypothetical protein